MAITPKPNDPRLRNIRPDGQQEAYLVLSEEERGKGFVRPLRATYRHVGLQPRYPLRDLTFEESQRYAKYGYVKYEKYPEDPTTPATGHFWTQAQLDGGCQAQTTMAQEIAETYARDPKFYGATFCCGCNKHLPVAEFVWVEGDRVTDLRVGS